MSIPRGDRRPGSMPDVTADADSTTFVFDVTADEQIPAGSRLVVRCDSMGDAWVRITKTMRGRRRF